MPSQPCSFRSFSTFDGAAIQVARLLEHELRLLLVAAPAFLQRFPCKLLRFPRVPGVGLLAAVLLGHEYDLPDGYWIETRENPGSFLRLIRARGSRILPAAQREAGMWVDAETACAWDVPVFATGARDAAEPDQDPRPDLTRGPHPGRRPAEPGESVENRPLRRDGSVLRQLAAVLLALGTPLPAHAQDRPVGAATCAALDPAARRELPSTLLPPGYLATSGSQIVDQRGIPVRIAAVGHFEGFPQPEEAVAEIVRAGFNAVRMSWVNATLRQDLQRFDPVVAAAKRRGLKLILANHTNEPGRGPQDNWGAQQKNGLWYDLGGASDDTDGGGNRGTTTDARFLADWVTVAQRYAGNDTVIGFDLRNEPLAIPRGSTWGTGDPKTDIRLMYERVGNAILAVNPHVLIIAEGPQNYRGSAAGVGPAPWGDLSLAERAPVRLNVPNRLVYSVHDYPPYVSGARPAGGPSKVAAMNRTWGYLVTRHIAPVWVGEMGANFDGSYENENVAESRLWAKTLVDYLNGRLGDLGGPTFSGPEQGVSTNWWLWGYHPGEQLVGTLDQNRALRPAQLAVYRQLRQHKLCQDIATPDGP